MPKLSSDAKWGRFNEKLQDAMKSNDFHSLGVIYYQMAEFAKKEGKNSDHLTKFGYQMKLRSQENSLLDYQKSEFIKEVDILCTSDSCDACKQIGGKVFTTEEALSSKPIPVKNCTYKYGCRCTYLARIEK